MASAVCHGLFARFGDKGRPAGQLAVPGHLGPPARPAL